MRSTTSRSQRQLLPSGWMLKNSIKRRLDFLQELRSQPIFPLLVVKRRARQLFERART